MDCRHPGSPSIAVCAFTMSVVVIGMSLAGCWSSVESNRGTNSNQTGQSDANAAGNHPGQENSIHDPDVIIVGAGISGLSAALELGRGGADVTVIDMFSVFGGHAVMSQGSVSVVGTPMQAAKGIKDTPELAYRDFINWGEDANADWVRYYVQNSRRDIYDWLKELGVRFEEVGSSPGNSVSREHQPIGRGIGLVTPIFRECLERDNIRFVWNTKAVQLLKEAERVVGVLTRNMRTQNERERRAGAVILATGGFQSNLDMVREFWPTEFRFPERILVGSGRNSVGSGHKLAQSVGGDLVKMDHQWNYFTGIPDPRYPGSNQGLSAANMYGIIVNVIGRADRQFWPWSSRHVDSDKTYEFLMRSGCVKKGMAAWDNGPKRLLAANQKRVHFRES